MSRSVLAVLVIYFLQSLAIPTVGEIAEDPCNNYISYACKDANTKTSLYFWRRFENNFGIGEYFRSINNTKTLTQAERKYFDLTKHCADLSLQDKKDLIQSFNFLKYNKGLESDKFDLEAAIIEMLQADIPPFYILTLSTDPTFKNRLSINLSNIIQSIISNYDYRMRYINNTVLSEYIENKEEVINDAMNVMDIYTTLKYQYSPREEITDVKGLKEKIPEYDWDRQIVGVFGQKLPDDYPVHIYNFEVVKRFIAASVNVPPKIMANYLLLTVADFALQFNTEIFSDVFEEVGYQFILKQLYSNANRKELKKMLHSFLMTLQKLGNLSNNNKQFHDEASEFINTVILPDANDDFLSNLYKDIEISPNSCLSNFNKLSKISLELYYKRLTERRIDYLNHLQDGLRHGLANLLPLNLNKTSPYKFLAFLWQATKSHANLKRSEVSSYNLLMQCLMEQNNELYSEYALPFAVQTQLLLKAYFDWMKTSGEFVKNEEQKFQFNAKALIFKEFIEPYCYGNTPTELQRYSNYLRNLDEFSEVYNCLPDNLNFRNKCQLV